MTPKEKAKELLDKMAYGNSYDEYHNSSLYTAKQCALIAVDELIEEACFTDEYIKSVFFTDGYYDRQDYWQEVKQEIELL